MFSANDVSKANGYIEVQLGSRPDDRMGIDDDAVARLPGHTMPQCRKDWGRMQYKCKENRVAPEMLTESFEDVLDDLFARFIMNLPKEEIESHSRLGFQLEQAWWFYDDFFRAENPSLPKLNLKKFGQALLGRYPEWTQLNQIDVDAVVTEFLKYKAQVPTCGAILLNPPLTKVLMVKGWNSGTWTFPKGKIGKGETPEQCAAREVSEEIGFDIGGMVSPSEYIQMEAGPHAVRLYLIPGVPETTKFQTLTRKEIGGIKWFTIADLSNPNTQARFYNVSCYLGRLKAFVKRQRKGPDHVAAEKPAKPAKQRKPKSAKTTPSKQPKKILPRPVLPVPVPVPADTGIFRFNVHAITNAFMEAWNKA